MIFTEDLKQFIHVTSGSDEQLSLAVQMMEKFHQQNAQLRFGSYHFGPVVMRMYYLFNKPDEALQAYYNPKLDGFFDHLSAHVILFDLLFINGKYEEIIELYEKVKQKQLFFGKYPRSLMILLFASCYKIVWREMHESGLLPLRRAACYLGALALKQNSPHVALEIVSALSSQNFVLVRSIKACSFCALGRIEEVITILRSVLTFDAPNIPKQTFPVDVTLDELLFSEISITKPVNRNQSVLRAAFNGAEDTSNRNRSYNFFRRPGLSDMS
ncbi:hypothetical protein V9T40_000256 [Parthenolecanium corni]|uniref:Pentatricopeptide repeat-containing protein n=1 Tax=Parthenolecanium corni TaxID=536013 RepID=A0AAN9Y0A5_9HEMI